MKTIKLTVAGQTCQGKKRSRNDDRFLIRKLGRQSLLVAVSDGLGGHPAGYMAAEIVMEVLTVLDCTTDNIQANLKAAVYKAEAKIAEKVNHIAKLEGMGATVVAALIKGNQLHWINVGDSRLYLFRSRRLHQITRDHSFVQDLLDSGDISQSEADDHPMAHVLDQCVGSMDEGPDTGELSLRPDDILLLCSDGLYRSLSGENITELLAASEHNMDLLVSRLLDSADRAEAVDDTTLVAVSLSAPGTP